MAGIARKLKYLYPLADSFFDWRVVNDGVTGDVITYWNEKVLGEQPKQDVLDAITDQQIADAAAEAFAQRAKAEAKASVDKGKLAEGTADQRVSRSIALALLEEINTLRSLQALPPRTEDDITRGIKEKIDLTPATAEIEVLVR